MDINWIRHFSLRGARTEFVGEAAERQHNGHLLAYVDTRGVLWHTTMSNMWCRVVKECTEHSGLDSVVTQRATRQLWINIPLNLGEGSRHAEDEQMGAAKAKLWSLLAVVGSLGCSLMPPGDWVKRRVYGEQQDKILNYESQNKKKIICTHLYCSWS